MPAEGLRAALYGRSAGANVEWNVPPCLPPLPGVSPAIALCDAAAVGAMTSEWPQCVVIAVVAASDDGSGVIAALQAGAATCVRGDTLSIAAAFIVAVARRAGVIPEDRK
jgi:hypothetical protein